MNFFKKIFIDLTCIFNKDKLSKVLFNAFRNNDDEMIKLMISKIPDDDLGITFDYAFRKKQKDLINSLLCRKFDDVISLCISTIQEDDYHLLDYLLLKGVEYKETTIKTRFYGLNRSMIFNEVENNPNLYDNIIIIILRNGERRPENIMSIYHKQDDHFLITLEIINNVYNNIVRRRLNILNSKILLNFYSISLPDDIKSVIYQFLKF